MDYRTIFLSLHHDFFSHGNLDYMSADEIYEELVLNRADFDYENFKLSVPDNVEFRFADTRDKAEMKKIQKAVAEVDEAWVQYFRDVDECIYCGFCGERVVSFCLVDEMGTFEADGKSLKIGGPGCVGTVPDSRRKGIGLKMVLNATKILFERGFDISWIHYTGVAPWYEKLGYKKVLKWNKKGFID